MRHAFLSAVLLALFVLTGPSALAQEPDLESILRFEGARAGEAIRGWGGGPAETIHFDSTVVHGGSGAARLERDADSPRTFTSITIKLPIDFDGEWIELRGFLRTEGVVVHAGLWMREDGPGGIVQFDTDRVYLPGNPSPRPLT